MSDKEVQNYESILEIASDNYPDSIEISTIADHISDLDVGSIKSMCMEMDK